MNKYQDALNKIVKSCCPNCIDENGCSSCDIEKICNATAKSWVNTLQELVNKENPKKFKKILDFSVVCPSCGHHLDKIYGRNYDYCPKCGQKLDWSEEWSEEDE